MRNRTKAFLAAIASMGILAVLMPLSATASAAAVTACATGWNTSTTYTGGDTVSYGNRNWSAKWWTRSETPGASPVWKDRGGCGPESPAVAECAHPDWVARKAYDVGDIVEYTNGQFYRASHANPGYDPLVSTWFWERYTCIVTEPGDFPVSRAQFDQMFPNRNPFYTYDGLVEALDAYPGFINTGSETVRKRELAAFLGNINHESGGLKYIVEINEANYPTYCDRTKPYGCPAGQAAYYGRGPIQLSWNFNYKAAGDSLGLDLLNHPELVEQNAAVAWMTALWYWNTQNGPGTMTPHEAMVEGHGFGETIRSINGLLECDGGNLRQVESRITHYKNFAAILGTTPGGNLSC